MKSFGSSLILIASLCLAVHPAGAVTRYVWTNSPAPGAPYTNWNTAAHTIQEAIDATTVGDTVLVTNGVYDTGGRPRPGMTHTNRICVTNAISIVSVNGPAYTHVVGNGARAAYLTNAILAGFTLRDSEAHPGYASQEDTSGGVILTDGAPVISNCVVANGYAGGWGGGIFNSDYDQAEIVNCLIKDSESGSYAGGVFFGNLRNCTVVGNHTGGAAGGVAQADVYNCIVVDNTSDTGEHNIRFGSVSYTCTTPLPVGPGNIDADPSFVDADRHLGWTSPCINAGNNGDARGAGDLDGSPRISGAKVDMGCYEAPQSGERALWFDGTDDYVETPDTSALDTDFGEALTIEAWFRTAAVSDQTILAKHNTGSDGSYALAATAAGNLRFTLVNAASNRIDHAVAVAYADDRWHHAAAIYDGAQMRILYDGLAVGGASAQTGRVNDTALPLRLGSASLGGWWFSGELDEVRMWRTARPDDAVRDNMHRHLTGNESNLVMYLRLNQVQGGEVMDWVSSNLTHDIARSGALWTNSTAALGTTRMLQEQGVRAAWIGRATRAPDAASGFGAAGEFASNSENAVWGHNGLSGVVTTNLPLGGTGDVQRTARIWYAEKSGALTGTTVSVNLDYAGAAGVQGSAPSDYRLLWSTSPATAWRILTNGVSGAGPEVTFAPFTLSNGYYAVGVPGPVATGPATNIGPVRATLMGTVWGWAGPVTNILFEYGTNTSYGLSVNAQPYGYDGAGSCLVTALVSEIGPGLIYHYRLTALVSNTLIRGADRWLQTQTLKVETGPPTNVALWTTMVLGVINPDNVPGTNIHFQYGLDSNTLGAVAAAVPSIVSGTNDITVTGAVPVLAAGTPHYYRLVVLFGPIPTYGGVRSFMPPMTSPVALPPAGHAFDAVVAAWQAVPGATNYLLDVSTNAVFTNYLPGFQDRATQLATTCSVGIVEGIPYYYRVAAQFPAGTGPESDVITVFHPAWPVHYVSTNGAEAWPYTNWATAARVLQTAMNNAAAGDTVLVGDGVYDLGGYVLGWESLTNRVYVWEGRRLVSLNGPAKTFIVGAAHPGTTNGDAAVRCVYMEGGGSWLIGFTLTNGHTRATDETCGGGVTANGWGDGAWVSNCILTGCSAADCGGGGYGVLFVNCVFEHNSAVARGGAADQCELTRCQVRWNQAEDGGGLAGGAATDCDFIENQASGDGGGAYASDLVDCRVTFNEAAWDGGGLYRGSAEGTVFEDNTAWYGGAAADASLSDCIVRNNNAGDGGGGLAGSGAERCWIVTNTAAVGGGGYDSYLVDSLLIGNASWNGGGSALSQLYGCTLVANDAAHWAGGSYQDVSVSSSILVDNTAPLHSNWYDSVILYSCTTPLAPGTSNIVTAPQFVNAAAGNFRLLPVSPCIDAGSYVPGPPEADLEDTPRPLDGDADGTPEIDMGCYEYLNPLADSDGDTMRDAWEILHQLYPLWPDDAPMDLDGDSSCNADEHTADSDPFDGASYFHIPAISGAVPSRVFFTPVSTARVYRLEYRASLLTGDWAGVTGQTNVPGTGPGQYLQNTNVAGSARFHRLKVRLP